MCIGELVNWCNEQDINQVVSGIMNKQEVCWIYLLLWIVNATFIFVENIRDW